MRVGIFSESYPPIVNGVSTSVRTLMAELERAGHTVYVFTSRAASDRGYTDDRPGVYRYPSVNSGVEPQYQLPIPFSSRIKSAIPTLGLDIIHSQSPFFLGLIARHVARKLHLPLVSTNHTFYTEYAHYNRLLPPPWTRAFLVRWMRWYYDGCDRVLVPSELTRRSLLAHRVRAPITVMPTGIPAPPPGLPSPDDVRRQWGIPPGGRVLLYVGRLAPEKNLEAMLKAFGLIRQACPDAWLILAGSGLGDAATRQAAQRLGVWERAVFTGFLQRAQLDPLYAAADVFLFPSKTETQGLAVGEAMACGTPCVVINAGGAPESVRDGVDGFLVDDDPAQMARQAIRLLEDPTLRQQMSQRALLHAAEMTPQKVAGRVIALYEELVTAAAGRPPKVMA
ncbi:MAG: glycosyltransferase family 4 protein [Armatimonadetes bacterium]|nr:glycosyltransferase family 4 protein [Armatimonadota bacterium]